MHNKQQPRSTETPAPMPVLSVKQRRQLARANRKKRGGGPTDERQIAPDVKVYTDDSYKDNRKKVFSHGLASARERIKAMHATFTLPEKVSTVLKPLSRLLRRKRTTCLVVNKDGRRREFMPDVPGRHRILVHGCVARQMVSGVCMLVRITNNEDKDGHVIDGSWAIVPAEYRMMKATTIQEVRRRPFFFLRRYWYEITFDGRVQPAHMLFDYGLNPCARSTRFYITHEYVPVRKQDVSNDYFRFWHGKPMKT